MNSKKDENINFCSSQPIRDKRFGEVVDDWWLTRWLKIHSFYQIIKTVCRVLTIKDVYNQSYELHPETLYQQYEQWKQRRPHWTVGQICFRIILFDMMIAWILSVIGAGLSMGCTQTLSNITTFITSRTATSVTQKNAYLQGLYFIVLFITQIYVNEQASRKSVRAGIKVQQILTYKIYDKLTTISNTYKKHLNKGEILSLFRIQTRHLFTFIATSHVLISAPTSIILSSVFIYIKVGYIGLVMLPVVIGCLLIQMVISIRMTRLNIRKQQYYQQRLAQNMNFYSQLDDIKSLGWEKVVIERNKIMRAQENRLHKLFYFYLNLYTSILLFAPSLTMLFYILLKFAQGSLNTLNARNAFTVYNYINQTNTPMANLPTTIRNALNAYNALKRLNNFFNAEEIQSHRDENLETGDIIIEDYVASLQSNTSLHQLWKRSQLTPFTSRSLYYLLNDRVRKQYTEAEIINPQFSNTDLLFSDVTIPYTIKWKKGQRILLLTSDTSLSNYILKCFVGELKTQKGSLKFKGKLGYINSHEILFLRDSIKKNILFEQKQDLERYQQILQALDLKKKFKLLEKGDETKIDDSYLIFSLTLRKKIALARCLYANSNILLLDWFFQSMEPDEANKLYNIYSNHPLIFKNKTVILSCKETYYLKQEDQVLIMKHGKAKQYGLFKDLIKNQNSEIHTFTSRYFKKIATDYLLPKQHKIMKYMNSIFNVEQDQNQQPQNKQNQKQHLESDRNLVYTNPKPYQPPSLGEYMEWSHYNKLIITGGVWLYFLLFFLNIGGGVLRMYSDWWIGIYSLSYSATNDAAGFIGKYCGMVVGVTIILFLAGLIHPLISINNTQALLDEVTEAITYCDNEALSKINKMAYAYVFSKDNQDIFKLNFLIQCILRNFVLYFGTIVFMGIVSWIVFLIGFILFICNCIVIYFYRKAEMELYNISISLRTQYSSVLETVINGMETIKTLQKTNEFRKIMMNKFYVTSPIIRMNARYTSHGLSLFGAWVALFTTVSIAFIGISMKFGLSPTQVTLVSAAISMANRLARRYMVLIARDFVAFSSTLNVSIKVLFDKLYKVYPIVKPTVELEQFIIKDNSISIQNLYKKSSGNKLATLQNINLFIPSNSRIALYGNINKDIQTLYKLICRVILPFQTNQYQTAIRIGNININSVSSKQLSKIIYVMNHDPFFFTGTVRDNLDPLNEYYDEQIVSTLNEVCFWVDLSRSKHFSNQQNFGRLDFYIYEMATQLPSSSIHKLNLARCILRKPKIILYLSAFRTASLSMRQFLRQVLYRNFSGKATLLMAQFDIAQTLRCDYLVGFKKGVIIQQGKPLQLVNNRNNRISRMVDIVSQNQNQFLLRNRKNIYIEFQKAIQLLLKQSKK